MRYCPVLFAVLVAFLLPALLLPPPAAAELTPLSGQPLLAVLEEMQENGLNLIFSEAVVSADLVVLTEPNGDSLRAKLTAILEPHGLGLLESPAGQLIVVKMQTNDNAEVRLGESSH